MNKKAGLVLFRQLRPDEDIINLPVTIREKIKDQPGKPICTEPAIVKGKGLIG